MAFMRWPLRIQIMLPMAAVMLLTVVVVGGVDLALEKRIESQVADVTQILRNQSSR